MAAGFDKLGWMDRCLRNADDLTPAEFRLLTVMYTYASSKDGGSIRPGRQRLIKESCLSEKTVKLSLKKLQELGYIVLVEKGGNEVRKGWASVYRLGYPKRVYENDLSTRGVLSDPLQGDDDPQGGYSTPEGGYSVPPRGVLSSVKGGTQDTPIHAYTQSSHPGINRFTVDSSESDGRESPGGLSKEQRTAIITAMLQVAAVEADPNSTQEESYEASMDYIELLLEHLGDDYEHLLDNRGYSDVPAYIKDNPYEAGKRLNIIINAGLDEGYTVEGAA